LAWHYGKHDLLFGREPLDLPLIRAGANSKINVKNSGSDELHLLPVWVKIIFVFVLNFQIKI
jgi:hypothetical protein